jgi:two-component system, cell cycle sensor histidine kinase and response regulator CckA
MLRASVPSDRSQPCILNVDDDDASRTFKSGLLQSAGYRALEARTGVEALALTETERPSLVLLDVHMPGLDGFEVCRRLKANPRTAAIPVLQISAARITEADWARGLESGADNYLIAPVSSEVILGTIRALLHRSQIEETLRAEQERALEALRSSDRRHRHQFLHAPYGIYTATADGQVLTANRALAQILGYQEPEEILALNASTFYQAPADRIAMLAAWERQDRVEDIEARWRTREGGELVVRLTGRRLREEAPQAEVFEVFVADITEQRRLEAERRQAHKMEAIGGLAAGIAHDFNNLLTAILGYTELMLHQIDADKPIHADLMQVHTAAQSAAALTKQLLAFGRKQTLRVEVVDVNDVVRTSEQLLRRIIGEDIRVVIDAAPTVHAVRADRVQLEQVLVNLAVNARDAMPEGGTLTIQTGDVEITGPRPFPWPVRVRPGPYVRVSVADTGKGMDSATVTRIFEPFFTTKELGRGTGLGLATVYGIVKQSDGYIWVSSEPHQGSTFSLYFPATGDAAPASASAPARPAAALGRETILVVEDDAPVRALVTSVLTRHGYRVIDTGSPEEAIALGVEGTASVALILADVVMPGMTGPALVRRLRAERPIEAIYMSGYAGAEITAALIKEGASLLSKPFTQTDLLKQIRQALDRAGAAGATP